MRHQCYTWTARSKMSETGQNCAQVLGIHECGQWKPHSGAIMSAGSKNIHIKSKLPLQIRFGSFNLSY